jgi:hypothetical protein
MDIAEHERRVEALEARVRDLGNQLVALKLALYAAFNSQTRTPEEALEEGRAGLMSHSGEVEHIMRLAALARLDLVLLGIVPDPEI